MVEVGRYNVDITPDVYFDNRNGKRYRMVILSLFDGEKEVGRKTFYFLLETSKDIRFDGEIKFGLPDLHNERFVDILFHTYKNNERFIFEERIKG